MSTSERCCASAVYGGHRVDVSACAWPCGTYLVVRVRGPEARSEAMEFVIDTALPDEALQVGLAWGRDFVDGRLH